MGRVTAAPEDPDNQWVKDRSAQELARARCGEEGDIAAPADFLALLETNPRLDDLEIVEGYAELKTKLRGERGGERNHDLLLVGRTPAEKVVLGIEGKADETFDKTLAKRWEQARKTMRRESGSVTNWPKRLSASPQHCSESNQVPDGTLNPTIAQVPYQLLSALAGTLIEAEDRRGAAGGRYRPHTQDCQDSRRTHRREPQGLPADLISRFAGVDAPEGPGGSTLRTIPGSRRAGIAHPCFARLPHRRPDQRPAGARRSDLVKGRPPTARH